MVPRNQIFACVIKQYGTGLYRACVYFNKGHTIFLSAHQGEEDAEEMICRFQEACRDGLIKTVDDVSRFTKSLDLGGSINRGVVSGETELSLAA